MKISQLFLCVSVACSSTLAQGAIYTSRSDFNAALGASTTITFENVAPTDTGGMGAGTITVSGVTVTNLEHQLFISSDSYLGTGHYLFNFDSSYPVGVFLPGGKTAFGADFSGGLGPDPSFNATLTFKLLGGQSFSYNFTGTQNAWTFVGATFAAPITSLVYDDGGQFFPGSHEEAFDNVTFGSAVPEPNCLLFVPLALLFLRLRRAA
jgi:hypothetical protein